MLKYVDSWFSTVIFVEKLVESVRFGLINNVCGFFHKNFFQLDTDVTRLSFHINYA